MLLYLQLLYDLTLAKFLTAVLIAGPLFGAGMVLGTAMRVRREERAAKAQAAGRPTSADE